MKLQEMEFNRKTKKPIIVLQGLNRNSLIKDNELSACQNISSKNRPVLSCRAPRETLYTLTSPQALFSVGTALAWVDGTSFKYNNVTKGTVTAGAKSMVDFNGKILIFPDKKYYDYGADTFDTIVDIGPDATVPDMDFVCEHMNRIFGCKGNDVYASALGQYNNWTTFAGLSSDAWAKEVASEGGSFTGIASYQYHPVIFKEDLMYEVFNSKPPFTTQPGYKVGCLSNRAIIEVNSVLYFAGKKGLYGYTGGVPRLVSDDLNETYSDAVMGTDGTILYVSLYNGTSWKLYTYNTKDGRWLQEDTLHVVQFTKIGAYGYGLASTGALYKFNSGTEVIEWNFETKQFTEEIFEKKGNGKISLRLDLLTGSTANVYVKHDNGAYALVKELTATGLRCFRIPLKIQMDDHFQVKISGTGDFKFHGIEREIIIGGDA